VTDPTLTSALAAARRDLLDLSPRNRLLALPEATRTTGALAVVGEKSESLWRLLVTERKSFGFAPAVETPAPEAPAEPAPDAPKPKRARKKAAATPAIAAAADPNDLLLSMTLGETTLPRVLLRLEQAARAFIEEQGIPLLFLTLGQLHWTDPKLPTKVRRAPLVLIPVTLARRHARDAFALAWSEAEVEGNETLAVMLKDQFGITLPPPPDFDERAEDGFAAVSAWIEAVRAAVAGQPGWWVEPDAVALGLFGFAKLLMARDLEHPRITASPLVRTLLAGGTVPVVDALDADADLDEAIRIERLDHVVDADASQTRAIEAARRGQSLVIQGPPGTGKSQTITNVIAQAVLDGKTVLFVAEKLAALSVVKRRLDQVGLGAACLELHSEKASRKSVLAELDVTLKTPRAAKPERSDLIERLGRVRGRLNRHARALHARVGTTGMSAYDAVGRIVLARIETPDLPALALPAAQWSAAEILERRGLTGAMADAVRSIGAPGAHAWRGAGIEAVTAEDVARIVATIPPALRSAAAARAAGSTLAQAMGQPAPADAAAAAALVARARAARAFQAAKAKAAGVTEAAWTLPGVAEARATIAEGGGFFSGLSSSWRAAQATLKAAAPNWPDDKAAQLALLDAVLDGQAVLRDAPDAARDPAPDMALIDALAQALDTLGVALGALVAAARFAATAPSPQPSPQWGEGVRPAGTTPSPHWGEGRGEGAPGQIPIHPDSLTPLPFAALTERLTAMAGDPDGLPAWLTWRRARDADPALAPLAAALADGTLTPDRTLAAFDRAVADAVWKAACRSNPELATFDTQQQERTAEEFRTLDKARLDLARAEAAAAHAARIPDGGGPLQVLRGEIAKKRGHMPIRAMLRACAPAVQAMKPVFMMSPLSVAQFLDAAAPRPEDKPIGFDMLVIDEASQVEPVDALGAIARCTQIVVVGDDRQMPPTQFFKTMTGEDESPPEETLAQARDVESILSLCNARGVPSEMLRWHYRSRHQSLIKVSNDNFYEGRLLVIPSPRARTPALGLSLTRVEGGVFDSGGEGVNLVEAKALAEAVLRHARETPKDTLGVAAFSVSQRDAILDAVEALRRDSPETESFFTGHADEPFFVKNLENVQGDERDAIFISIGYAPDKDGKFAMRFGPLSAEGGERRLNVLITRAKKRCTVFSSISSEQIDLERAAGRGVAVLKDFLAYAAQASGTAADGAAEAAAPFARAVQLALAKEGVGTRARVGLSGLFLDLAVAAPEGNDLALGIGSDGPFYVLARGARDRDRQRDGALGMMGWKLARTWSAGWLARPDAEARALVAAARAATGQAAPDVAIAAAPSGLAAPYAPAALEVPKDTPIPRMPFAKLGDLAAEVVRQEGPVPTELVVLRLCTLWGTKPDAESRAAVQQALRLAKELSGLSETSGFWLAERATAAPRDRSALPVELRRASLVAPTEWRAAILALVDASQGFSREQIEVGAAKLLGLDASARGAASAQLALLEGEGVLAERAGLVVRA
jgi:hypothetical protein